MGDRAQNARKPRAVTMTKIDLLEELEDDSFLDKKPVPTISAPVPIKKPSPVEAPVEPGLSKSPSIPQKPKAAPAEARAGSPLATGARPLPKPAAAPKLTTPKPPPVSLPPVTDEDVTPPPPKRAPPPSAIDGAISPRSPRSPRPVSVQPKSVSFNTSPSPTPTRPSSPPPPTMQPPASALRAPSPARVASTPSSVSASSSSPPASAGSSPPSASAAPRSISPMRVPSSPPATSSGSVSPRPVSPARSALRPTSPARSVPAPVPESEAAPVLGGAESAAKKEEERLARMLNAKSGSKTSLLKPMAVLGPPRPPAVVPPKKGSAVVVPASAARAPPGGLTAEEIALCKQKFKEADRDNSGKVDQGELVHLLEDLFGSRIDKGLVKRLAQMQFIAADKDKSGTIDEHEFAQVYAFLKTEEAKGAGDRQAQQQQEEARKKEEEQRKADAAAAAAAAAAAEAAAEEKRRREEEEAEAARQAEEEKKRVEEEAKRKAEEEKKKAEEEKRKAEEEKKRAEAEKKRQEDERKKAEIERKKKEELERRRREEEELEQLAIEEEEEKRRKKEEEERKRKQEEERKKAEEEKRRKAEEEERKRREEEEKARARKAEEERKRKEEERRRKQEEDDRRKKQEEEDRRRKQEEEERQRRLEEEKRRKAAEEERRRQKEREEEEQRLREEEEEKERQEQEAKRRQAEEHAEALLAETAPEDGAEPRWSIRGGEEDVDDTDFLDDLDSLASELRSEREERSVSRIQRDVAHARASKMPGAIAPLVTNADKEAPNGSEAIGNNTADDNAADEAAFDEMLQERYMVESTVGQMEGELNEMLNANELPGEVREQLSNTLKRLNQFKDGGETTDDPMQFLAKQAGAINNARKSVRLMPTPAPPPTSGPPKNLDPNPSDYQKPLPLPPPKDRKGLKTGTAATMLAAEDQQEEKRELPPIPEDPQPPAPLPPITENIAVELELAPERPTITMPSPGPGSPRVHNPVMPAEPTELAAPAATSVTPAPAPAPTPAAAAAAPASSTATALPSHIIDPTQARTVRPQPTGMLPQPSGAPNGIMWGFLGKKEGAAGLKALLSRKESWEIRWVVVDDRSGAIIYGLINRKKHFERKGEIDIRDAMIQEVSDSAMNRPGVFRVRPKGANQRDHFFCHMYDPKQSEVWIQAMVYCGATLSRETSFSMLEATMPEGRAAAKTRGATAAPNTLILPNMPGVSKAGKIEKLSGSLFGGWKSYWATVEDHKLSIYELKGDQPDQKQKTVVDLPSCQISELLQGTFKGRKYCLHGNTPVTLACGVSMRIKDLGALPEVLTLSTNNTFVPASMSAHIVQGQQECLKVVFSDGRDLICTPDHLIYTTDGWLRADQLVSGKSRVVLGPEAPLYDPAEDHPEHLASFSFAIAGVALHMRDPHGVARAHAFARLLGFLYTNGSASFSDKSHGYRGHLYFGHVIDVNQAVNDFELVTGTRLTYALPTERHNYYMVHLPSSFLRALHDDPRICLPNGKRVEQEFSLPTIILDANTPKSFVREFLAALFGGDGGAPVPKENGWSSVAFANSKVEPLRESLVRYYNQITKLLMRFDIYNVAMGGWKSVTNQHPNSVYPSQESVWTRRLSILVDEMVPFQERVGFRYCVHKQQRLAVAAAFYRSRNYSIAQASALANAFDLKTGFSTATGAKRKLKMSGTKAYEEVVKEFTASEVIINSEMAIPSYAMLRNVLVGTCSRENLGTHRSSMTPRQFIANVGATEFFSETTDADNAGAAGHGTEDCETGPVNDTKDANPRRSVRYGVSRDLDGFSTWTAVFMGSKPAGMHHTYDISVPGTHNFVAMGITVHNCLRLLENRKKEIFLATDTSEVLREWLRVMIAEGAVANSGK